MVARMARIAPYGMWRSPVTLERLVDDVVGLSYPCAGMNHVYWVESRPSDAGRQVLVCSPVEGGALTDVFGADFSVRTLVHEYGGLCYAVHDPAPTATATVGTGGEPGTGTDAGEPPGPSLYFSNFLDQRVYRIAPGAAPVPITSEPPRPRSVRYAAHFVTNDGKYLVCVRETHSDPDLPKAVVNDLVVIPTSGDGDPRVVARGHDFYSSPVLSPDGRLLAWTSWDHPNMPWDGTELWEAEIDKELHVRAARLVAGGATESVIQPKYGPDGALFFSSDRTGWWNLYEADRIDGLHRPLAPMETEIGGPDWQFGSSAYAVLSDGVVVAAWADRGVGHLGILDRGSSSFRLIPTVWSYFSQLRASADGRSLLAVASSATMPSCVVRIEALTAVTGTAGSSGGVPAVVYKRSRSSIVDAGYMSSPEPIAFPTAHGRIAHALVYHPANVDFEGPTGERPPLIVRSHGGPTSAATAVLDYEIQFWTSRGFALVDVNYGGSTGYGREYRQRLRGAWGVVDVEDCVHAAQAVVDAGDADERRLLIHGGSAGGYTTLCATTCTDVFAAGASYFGIADTTVFVGETHKFESHYMDSLFGPWPETEAVYRDRSPISHTDRLRTPLIIFQGLEDKVVPPDQAEIMVAALRANGVPHAYITYEGEQHGFRKAENVMRTSEAELYFYGRILGFEPADLLRPVDIFREDHTDGTLHS